MLYNWKYGVLNLLGLYDMVKLKANVISYNLKSYDKIRLVQSTTYVYAKWLEYKGLVYMRLRQFSVLKPEGCEHRPITLNTHKSIYRPIRRRLPKHIKHQKQQTAARMGLKGIIIN